MYLYIYISISIATGYLYLHPYLLYIYRILPGTSISLIYCALTTKTNRIARILAVKKMITYKPRLVFSMIYIYRYLNISLYSIDNSSGHYQAWVPGLGTHCGLVWSELCTQAWYPGLVVSS